VSDDDDWFERALQDENEDEESPDDGREPPEEPGAEGTDAPDDRDEGGADGTAGGVDHGDGGESDDAVKDGDDRGSDGDRSGVDDESTTVPEDSGDGGGPTNPGGSADTDSDSDTGTNDGDADDDGGPFDQGFGSALADAPEPDIGSEGSQPGGGDSPFGGGGQEGGDSPFGGGQEGGDSPFGGGQEGGDSPFGGGGQGGGDGFGFGDVGGDDPESFDEEEFESDLERLDVGVDGLDQMILGGIPRRSLMVAIGSAGTGKTTLGLQFLHHGLQHDEDAVYITLEESYDRIISTADEKGWGFGEYVDDDRLAIVDIDPIEMANSLDSIQNDLPNLIEDFGADRLVLDSVSLLEMMYESAPKRRSQVFGFARALKNAGITILLTSEADRNHAYASRFGIVEYLADAVFVLQYVRPSDFRETRLAIEIQKIRDANHSRETKPYDLTDEGISVYRQANIF